MPAQSEAVAELKKLVGTPKVIMVLGGPAAGKGTQCDKLVEEFGYTHISTGDLLRQAIAEGTEEGRECKKIMDEGGLVPDALTVQLLVKGMLASPSKNYLIDGFPRALEQAKYFEQNVFEAQQVLFYEVPQEVMLERCLKRAEASGDAKRSDDSAETLQKRVQTYVDQTQPVVEFYKKFGKVSTIDATGGAGEVYAQTRDAIFPQTMFLLGQKASGKSTVARKMADRTNMKHIDFPKWVLDSGLEGQDDETVCLQLIQTLAEQQKPRVVLESFPQNEFQAKFFLRNCAPPSNVFSLTCSIDISQERMNSLQDTDSNYVSSIALSQAIKAYSDVASTLIPFLEEKTNFSEINTEGTLDKTMELVNARHEPCVIHVRPGAKTGHLRKEMTEQLCTAHGFVNLDVTELTREESHRRTTLGLEMQAAQQAGRPIPASVTVRMLQKIIYCGQAGLNKYILTNFPDSIDQVREFEANCAKIQTVIYSASDAAVVEILNNNLALHNIDSQFQKEFRLQTMSAWDYSVFQEKLGNKVEYGVLVGQSNSGKTTLAGVLKSNMEFTVIDMKAISDAVRASMANEDGEAFEGEVPLQSVEEEVIKIINQGKSGAQRVKYLFDGFLHGDAAAFVAFLEQFGVPSFVGCLTASEAYLKGRHCKKAELDEFPEDALEGFKEQADAAAAAKEALTAAYSQFPDRCNVFEVDTGASLETTTTRILSSFAPQIILVNHEKRLAIDTPCANLAIKYNMIYISAYQVIAEHVKNNTSWGKQLMTTKRAKQLKLSSDEEDQFQEGEFSPALYDQKLVIDLIRSTIQEKRTNQKFVLLEGFCNSAKLEHESDKLEVRMMDEFFQIEKHLGEVRAVFGLQDELEEQAVDASKVALVEFPAEAEGEKKPVAPAEGDEAPADGGEEGGEAKAPAFEPKDYQWTVTNKQARNLPQLFLSCKPKQTTKHEVKKAASYSSSESAAISGALDELCQQVQGGDGYSYTQVLFGTGN